jgi:hypothetical protein
LSNSPRDHIAAAFDRELATTPVPQSLRSQAVRAAVHDHRRFEPGRPSWMLTALAAILTIALIATLVIGSHLLRSNVIPAKSGPPPAPRIGATIVYDQARGNLVLFSGSDGKSRTYLDDTWTWNGRSWTQVHPPKSPPGRQQASMAYDPARKVVVLFGGLGSTPATKPVSVNLNDTWTWDGRAWTEHRPQHVPALSGTWPSAMAFDPIARVVLLYGHTPTDYAMQTWAWNGSDWMPLHPATDPGIAMASMVGTANQVLLLGQGAQIGGRYIDQTWTWEGGDWKRLQPKVNLSAGAAVYDAQHGDVVAFDGADTWIWDGATWTREHPGATPSGMGYIVYFSALHKVIMWGDQNNVLNGELWAWDGTAWTLLDAGPAHPTDTSGGKGYLGTMTPAAAEAAIRQTVKNSLPLLMPSWLPAGLEAQVTANADNFGVRYVSDQRDKTISWGILVAQPGPGGPNASEVHLKFRSGTADYYVYDTTGPLSQRWLMWTEPGTMANPQLKGPGVPYFLSADGLTDQEFWQIGNSLK